MNHALTRRLGLLALVMLAPFHDAVAHPRVLRAVPASDSHVRTAPRELTVTFDEPLSVALCRLTLVDANQRPVTLDSLRLALNDAKTLTVRILGTLAAGRYTVKWQAAGADGHPVRGEYAFETDANAESVTTVDHPQNGSEVGAPGDEFGVASPAYVAIRAIQSIAIISLLGVLVLHLVVLPRVSGQAANGWAAVVVAVERATLGWASAALWTVGAATVARLVAQHVAVFGTDESWSGTTVAALLLHSAWGGAWWLALAATVLGLWALRRLRRTRAYGWPALSITALMLVVSVAMSGHAAAAASPTLRMSVHALHILGAGGWIGTLAALAIIAIPSALRAGGADRYSVVASLVRAFSPVALVAAGLLATTGVFAAWQNLGALSALWTATYGKVLLAKLSMLSVAAATGAYNWKRVLPLLGNETATRRLRRSASVELAAALVVLVITAVLVATPMPVDLASGMGP